LQQRAYLSDKEELKQNQLGTRVFGRAYKAAMIITDFTLLSPSSSRHQDMIFHVYLSDNVGQLKSSVTHYVGEDNQKNNAGFAVGME
jgi:hypothetical protein